MYLFCWLCSIAVPDRLPIRYLLCPPMWSWGRIVTLQADVLWRRQPILHHVFPLFVPRAPGLDDAAVDRAVGVGSLMGERLGLVLDELSVGRFVERDGGGEIRPCAF